MSMRWQCFDPPMQADARSNMQMDRISSLFIQLHRVAQGFDSVRMTLN